MRALILAAGFGTRLDEGFNNYNGHYREKLAKWVEGKPKALVSLEGKPIIEHQFEQLKQIGIDSENVYIHTNAKYYQQFLDWAKSSGIPEENIFNNGVTMDEDRLEQVQDMLLGIFEVGYDQPLILFASDTLVYDQNGRLLNLSPLVQAYQDGYSAVVAYYKAREAFKHGVLSTDEDGIVTCFREKPKDVDSGLVNASVYFFNTKKLEEMRDRAEELATCRNPLELIWEEFKVVKAGKRVDVGTIEDVLKANGVMDE